MTSKIDGHLNECGHRHNPPTTNCRRCHQPIFRSMRRWFACNQHGTQCIADGGTVPRGRDYGITHTPVGA